MDSSRDWGEASPIKDPAKPIDADMLWDVVPPPPANSPPRGATKVTGDKDDFNIDKIINAHNCKPDNDEVSKSTTMDNNADVKMEPDTLVKVEPGPTVKTEPGTLLRSSRS